MAVTDTEDTVGKSEPAEMWAIGNAYEPYMGRWSRAVGREFLAWLDAPPGARWLDVGCGTGALSETILDVAAPTGLVGVDASPGFVAYARSQVLDSRAHFQAGDARILPVETGAFDAVVSGLVLNFVPDPASAVADMTRAARPGGIVGAYVWDYAGGMEFVRRFWTTAAALDPAASELDEGRRFAGICHREALADLFQGAGLDGVATCGIDVPTVFRDFGDYWKPFLGGQGPAPAFVASLSPDRQADLRERIHADLPVAADGSISLVARAWAVKGERLDSSQPS
jgi:SAM-dependent methyltransferase